MPEIICVDANFIGHLLSDPPDVISYSNLWRQWKSAGNQIIAPTIYCYEVTNVFHRLNVSLGVLVTAAIAILVSVIINN